MLALKACCHGRCRSCVHSAGLFAVEGRMWLACWNGMRMCHLMHRFSCWQQMLARSFVGDPAWACLLWIRHVRQVEIIGAIDLRDRHAHNLWQSSGISLMASEWDGYLALRCWFRSAGFDGFWAVHTKKIRTDPLSVSRWFCECQVKYWCLVEMCLQNPGGIGRLWKKLWPS